MAKRKESLLNFAAELSEAYAQLNRLDRSNLDVWFQERDSESIAWEEHEAEQMADALEDEQV